MNFFDFHLAMVKGSLGVRESRALDFWDLCTIWIKLKGTFFRGTPRKSSCKSILRIRKYMASLSFFLVGYPKNLRVNISDIMCLLHSSSQSQRPISRSDSYYDAPNPWILLSNRTPPSLSERRRPHRQQSLIEQFLDPARGR